MILLFADDVVLIAHSYQGLSAIYGAFKSFCIQHRLTISVEKTKAMITKGYTGGSHVSLGGDEFEVISQFRYLGVWMDE